MGIYLPNMEIPRFGYREIRIHPDRMITERPDPEYPCYEECLCKAVHVPPHGNLIDTSEKIRVQLYDDMTEDFHMVEMTIDDLLSQGWVEAVAPTIIPAEEGE